MVSDLRLKVDGSSCFVLNLVACIFSVVFPRFKRCYGDSNVVYLNSCFKSSTRNSLKTVRTLSFVMISLSECVLCRKRLPSGFVVALSQFSLSLFLMQSHFVVVDVFSRIQIPANVHFRVHVSCDNGMGS